MSRQLNDWITSYLKYVENTEPPFSYHLWCGISVIAATLERRCVFKWSHNEIFPNQYIVLVGPSGVSRKGTAMSLAKPFFFHTGLSIAPTSATREALIEKIVDSNTGYIDQTGTVFDQSPVTIISPELAVLLGNQDTKFLADLTDWYDSDVTWTYRTRKKGEETINGVCVNILAATAPDWLPSILPEAAVGGGWTSRVIFVVERMGNIVADPDRYPPDTVLKTKLEDDLEEIKQLVGEFRFSKDARDAYIDWYTQYNQLARKGIMPISDPKFGGYVARRATHLQKLCMAISASRRNSLEITLEDFNRAVKILLAAEKKMSLAFSGLGRDQYATITTALLDHIREVKVTTRSAVLRDFYRDMNSWVLDQVERVLVEMRVLKVEYIGNSTDKRYTFMDPQKGP